MPRYMHYTLIDIIHTGLIKSNKEKHTKSQWHQIDQISAPAITITSKLI